MGGAGVEARPRCLFCVIVIYRLLAFPWGKGLQGPRVFREEGEGTMPGRNTTISGDEHHYLHPETDGGGESGLHVHADHDGEVAALLACGDMCVPDKLAHYLKMNEALIIHAEWCNIGVHGVSCPNMVQILPVLENYAGHIDWRPALKVLVDGGDRERMAEFIGVMRGVIDDQVILDAFEGDEALVRYVTALLH